MLPSRSRKQELISVVAVMLFFVCPEDIERYCAVQGVESWRGPVFGFRTVVFACARIEGLRRGGGVGAVSG